MAFALVKLLKKRNGKNSYFLDYISYDLAKLKIQIQGNEHLDNEWSKPEIICYYKDGERQNASKTS